MISLTWKKNTVVPELGREIFGASFGPGDNSEIEHMLRGEVCKIPKGGTAGWLWALDVGGHIWGHSEFVAWCYAEEFKQLMPSWATTRGEARKQKGHT